MNLPVAFWPAPRLMPADLPSYSALFSMFDNVSSPPVWKRFLPSSMAFWVLVMAAPLRSVLPWTLT